MVKVSARSSLAKTSPLLSVSAEVKLILAPDKTAPEFVKDVAESEVKKFKSEFTSLVTKQVVEQSMEMAVDTLRKSLGIQTKK